MKKKLLVFILGLGLCTMGCEGPDGDPGPQGPAGPQGDQGLVGNDGTNGADGADGKDAPNRTFYFQDGFKGYAGAKDGNLRQAFPDNNYGTLEYVRVRHNAVADPQEYEHAIFRFDDIDQSILAQLGDDSIEGCENDFFINEVVLYVYAENAYSTFVDGDPRLEVVFFGATDTMFNEEAATWNSPDGINDWFMNGGSGSEAWAAQFSEYSVALPYFDNKGEDLGWIGIPIPRQIVKKWICDPVNWNKGIMLKLEVEDSELKTAYINFKTREDEVVDMRPLLYINAEPANTSESGRVLVKSWEEQLYKWQTSSYADQMAPLYQHLNSGK